jgi:hypothetical protein
VVVLPARQQEDSLHDLREFGELRTLHRKLERFRRRHLNRIGCGRLRETRFGQRFGKWRTRSLGQLMFLLKVVLLFPYVLQ